MGFYEKNSVINILKKIAAATKDSAK